MTTVLTSESLLVPRATSEVLADIVSSHGYHEDPAALAAMLEGIGHQEISLVPCDRREWWPMFSSVVSAKDKFEYALVISVNENNEVTVQFCAAEDVAPSSVVSQIDHLQRELCNQITMDAVKRRRARN